MDIAKKHQQSKITAYWDDLLFGPTSRYKLKALDGLLENIIQPIVAIFWMSVAVHVRLLLNINRVTKRTHL